MQKNFILRLRPEEAVNEESIRIQIAQSASLSPDSVFGFIPLKQSIDSRGRQPMIQLSLKAYIDEPFQPRDTREFYFPDVRRADHKVIIIGSGPAGLFAALSLIENGIKPIIMERGRDVRARRRDLALLNKEGKVNPESNYCFGEGGAGTYSDGKLYTRSSKRGDVQRILQLFVYFGAEEKILYESHPHIGTNKLPQIISSMRKRILDCGGEIHFETKLTDLELSGREIRHVITADGSRHPSEMVILATGHSARDIFILLHQKNILIEAKPFALGVRVEHPQSLIDTAQYHVPVRGPFLPPASYSWVQQVEGKGVFSFCMCPGGIIAPAATSPGELVVNGWSPSKRNNPFANSGIVVTVERKDALDYFRKRKTKTPADALLLMRFQQDIERKAFDAGGGKFVAPAMRLVDFTENKLSVDLPACSYVPGIHPASFSEILPGFIISRLQTAFKETGKKMKGYLTNDAVVLATESRTSSPVKIPRDPQALHHTEIKNLYPCGEGAGYAGGIVSAAMDGENVAKAIVQALPH